jgi:hypothetical protein
MTAHLAYDPGYGNIKLFGAQGSLVMQSAVSVGDAHRMGRMVGLRLAHPPLCVETSAGVFHVGPNAHDYGRPVENLDFERLTGSPEMMALWYGALTKLGVPSEPTGLIVGLPIHVLMGDSASQTQQAVRGALRGIHSWIADGQEMRLVVDSVRITSQPVGAMFDYLLTDQGQMLASRSAAFAGEIGVLGIGMNTLDLLVVRKGSPVERFTAGETLGVRRLLEIMSGSGGYSLAERDAMLRSGALQTGEARDIWRSEVIGFIERQWSSAFQRFRVVVACGGGSILLKEALLGRFKERLFMADDPIVATARGLHKFALMQGRRPAHG